MHIIGGQPGHYPARRSLERRASAHEIHQPHGVGDAECGNEFGGSQSRRVERVPRSGGADEERTTLHDRRAGATGN
jgi:hypothetical protein